MSWLKKTKWMFWFGSSSNLRMVSFWPRVMSSGDSRQKTRSEVVLLCESAMRFWSLSTEMVFFSSGVRWRACGKMALKSRSLGNSKIEKPMRRAIGSRSAS